MPTFSTFAIALRLAVRDMRGGARGLRLLVAGVCIGVAAMTLVGVTAQGLLDGARQGALHSVGGDISLRLFHRPPSEAERAAIDREGENSLTAELRPMVHTTGNGPANGTGLLVELKGVDGAYPLYGSVATEPALPLARMLAPQDGLYGAVADQALFEALNLNVGDRVRIGAAHYHLRGVLVSEPDRAFRAFTLGPRLMVAGESLPTTGVAEDGSQIYYYTRLKLAPGPDIAERAGAAMARIDHAFPDAGWRMVNAHEGVPGVERALLMAHVVVLFIGLGVMLVGGAGISGAVRAHVAEKMIPIAILKSIGTPAAIVTLTIGIEVMAAGVVGTGLGLALGAGAAALAAIAWGGHLPFTLSAVPGLAPLLVAGLFGMLVTALFAWWPLMGVRHMGARMLLRERVRHTPGRMDWAGWMGAGGFLATLVAVVFWASPMPVLTAGFLVGALLITVFYYMLGRGVMGLARAIATRLANGRSKGTRPHLRMALGNLYRAGAPTGPVVMALGLTLSLLVALDAIGGATRTHMDKALPHSAPDMVAFSVSPETVPELETRLDASGVVATRRVLPFLHARVQAINGVAVGNLKIPGSMNWVIRGDRGVTFADGVAGDTPGAPGFSVEDSVARKLGLEAGDTLTLNVSGHVRTAPITGFHTVDWTGLTLDFPIIATPRTFADIPFTYAAAIKAHAGEAARLESLLKTGFPDVPLIRVADVLDTLATALAAIVAGLKAAALMCGLAALVVLAGSVLQGLRERRDDVVLFKVLGARRHQLLGQLAMEFSVLGVLVALVSVPLGLAVAHGVARAAGLDGAGIAWGGALGLAAVAVLVTVLVGLAVTMRTYGTNPARMLRDRPTA